MKGWCVLAFFDVESYLEYIRNNSPSCKMNHLCTLFAYTRTRMESSLEICVLKYQKWWFMSGEIEIISAFFFILSLHLIFLKPQKKNWIIFFFLNSTVFPKSSESESWKWLSRSLPLILSIAVSYPVRTCSKSGFRVFLCAVSLWL